MKRSVAIGGHRTSYSVEDEFHAELGAIARRNGEPVARLIGRIDAARPQGNNLSSAIRLYVLRHLNTEIQRFSNLRSISRNSSSDC